MRFKDVEKYPKDWLGSITHSDMMANDFPVIIDRTEAHVKRIEELNKKHYDNLTPEQKKEWNGVVKGAYNASDMNRVGQAEEYLVELLHEAGYTVNVTPKTDWKMEDFPNVQQMMLYRAYASRVNNGLSGTTAIPLLIPSVDPEKANTVEKALLEIYQYYQLMQRGYYYSGELYTGEV